MKTKIPLFRIPILLFLFHLTPLHAAVLVEYGNLHLASPGRLSATAENADLVASVIGWGSGYTVLPTVVETAADPLGLPVNFANPTTSSVTAATAYAADEYFTFTITSDFAEGLAPGLLSMNVQSTSNGKRSFSIYATPTGGTNSGDSFVLLDSKVVPTTGAAASDPSLAVASVDLTALTAFQGVTSIDVYLIFHGFGSSSASSKASLSYIDDVSFEGAVVPEPSSMALMALAAAFSFFRRRRRASIGN